MSDLFLLSEVQMHRAIRPRNVLKGCAAGGNRQVVRVSVKRGNCYIALTAMLEILACCKFKSN